MWMKLLDKTVAFTGAGTGTMPEKDNKHKLLDLPIHVLSSDRYTVYTNVIVNFREMSRIHDTFFIPDIHLNSYCKYKIFL